MAYPDDGSNLFFVVEQHTAKIWSFPNDRMTPRQAAVLRAPRPDQPGKRRGPAGPGLPPQVQGEQAVLRLLFGQRQRQATFGRLAIPAFERQPPGRRPGERAADLGLGGRPVREPQRRHDRVRAGRLSLHHAGRQRRRRRSPVERPESRATGSARSCGSTSIIPRDGKPYGIPADNPARRAKKFAHWAPEVYCIGLRNVWKFSFDRQTGDLWAGDVGQNLWEMVHRIENGGNYGWSIKEGFHPFQPQRRQRPDAAAKIPPPIVEYPHAPTRDRPDSGLSITGGYVYRGKKIPALVGVYVYGDFDSGRIWGLRYENGKVVANGELIDVSTNPKLNIASFGEDAQGELYILAFDGRIHELVSRAEARKRGAAKSKGSRLRLLLCRPLRGLSRHPRRQQEPGAWVRTAQASEPPARNRPIWGRRPAGADPSHP